MLKPVVMEREHAARLRCVALPGLLCGSSSFANEPERPWLESLLFLVFNHDYDFEDWRLHRRISEVAMKLGLTFRF